MRQIKVGVVGAGRMGLRHCRIYSNLRRVDFVGLCDSDVKAGERVAKEYEVPVYANLDELLEQVDAVSLTAPTPLHYELALRCLDSGVHVLIEKPITETLEQAQALVQAAEAKGVVVLVGHIERFNPAYIELKNVIEGMNILAVNFRRLSPYAGSNTHVDVVLDLLIHDANLLLDLMKQEPTSLHAQGFSVFGDDIDHAIVQTGFDEGPLTTVTASRVTEHKIRSIEVTARDAYVECDLLNKSILAHRHTIGEYLSHNHRGTKYRQESIVERIQVPIFEPLFLELQHFVDCILDGVKPMVSARDGWMALRLVDAVRRDILQHKVPGRRQRKLSPPVAVM
jgi:predicted dehydrogenase